MARYYELAAAGQLKEAKNLRVKYLTVRDSGFGPFSEVKIGIPESPWDSEKMIYEKGVRLLSVENEIVEGDKRKSS